MNEKMIYAHLYTNRIEPNHFSTNQIHRIDGTNHKSRREFIRTDLSGICQVFQFERETTYVTFFHKSFDT